MLQTTCMRKSTATVEPRHMRLKKLQLVIDEQSPMRIRPDSLIFLVKRKLQEYNVLLNHRQMLREWHTQRDTRSIQRLVPDQYLLGAPYVSPLCMFGESVFALIPDHEVRAAKLTNTWISGCWWGRDASSDEHLVGTKHVMLKCR